MKRAERASLLILFMKRAKRALLLILFMKRAKRAALLILLMKRTKRADDLTQFFYVYITMNVLLIKNFVFNSCNNQYN